MNSKCATVINVICLLLLFFSRNYVIKSIVFSIFTIESMIDVYKEPKLLNILIYPVLVIILFVGFFVFAW